MAGHVGEVRLCAISSEPLDEGAIAASVRDAAAGGVVVFTGAVRDHDGPDDRTAVAALSYSAHPTAAERLREVCELVAARPEVIAVSAVHRVGDLQIGDLAVVTAVSCAHRGDAFDACRVLIDTLKETVPVWKQQSFVDGSQEWVGTP